VKRTTIYEQRPFAFVASTPTVVNLGYLDMIITGIDINFVTSLTGAGAIYQDWLPRMVSGITLSDGQRNYVGATGTPDIRPLYWGVRNRHQGRFRVPNWLTGTQVFNWDLPLCFSPEPQLYDDQLNWYDDRVGIIPSSGLTLSINWGSATGIGAANTVAAAGKTFALITYYGVIPEGAEPNPRFYPQWQTALFTPTATSQALAQKYPFNSGPYYRRTHVMLTKGAQAGGADQRFEGYTNVAGVLTPGTGISEVGIVTADTRATIFQKAYQATQASQAAFTVADDNAAASIYSGAAAVFGVGDTSNHYNPGVYHYDWAKYLKLDPADADGPVFGVNSAGKVSGSFNLGFTVDAVANNFASIMQESYVKYQ